LLKTSDIKIASHTGSESACTRDNDHLKTFLSPLLLMHTILMLILLLCMDVNVPMSLPVSRVELVLLSHLSIVYHVKEHPSKTAFCTMEARITALAHCCKEPFLIIDLAQSFASYFKLDPIKTTMKVSFHEDNAAALIMANSLPLNTCYTINSFS
jgi:hypothetical protein